jgi:hypothetical protein
MSMLLEFLVFGVVVSKKRRRGRKPTIHKKKPRNQDSNRVAAGVRKCRAHHSCSENGPGRIGLGTQLWTARFFRARAGVKKRHKDMSWNGSRT